MVLLVCNPPSLKLLSVCRIRQSISCLGEDVEHNLIEKLNAGDLDGLRNPNVPISLQEMCLLERKFVMESCLKSDRWGLLELFILLTDDIVKLDDHSCQNWDDPDTIHRQLATAINIRLDHKGHDDLFLSLLIARCPKLECLTLRSLAPSPPALEKFCQTMKTISELYVYSVDDKNNYDGVLRAIATNMPDLKRLNIPNCTVEAKAIECLLPTEGGSRGCPKLVELNLSHITNGDVMLLKKIILALPNLRSLTHDLFVDALMALTEDEMGVDTARSLDTLDVPERSMGSPSIRYDILVRSPVFPRLINNITNVDIVIGEQEERECALIADVLMSMTKLRVLSLWGTSEARKHFLPVLESIGDQLQDLDLHEISRSLSLHDVMRTCPQLVDLQLCHYQGDESALENVLNMHDDQIEKPSKMPVLQCLTRVHIETMDKQICSADMLIALLQSPKLNSIHLSNLGAMSDDVMFNVLSSPAALSNVTEFEVYFCPLLTAAPFVHWIDREKCLLKDFSFSKHDNIDYKILRDVAERCPRALIIDETEYESGTEFF